MKKEELEQAICDALVQQRDTSFRITASQSHTLSDWKGNIYPKQMEERFEKMFNDGDGSELKGGNPHASAPHSSSMLCFNFLHWVSEEWPLIIDDAKYTKVYFEVKLKTLPKSSRRANIDAVLVGRNEKTGKTVALFIESKFTEYLYYSTEELAKSYKQKESYYTETKNLYDWMNKEGRYNSGVKQNLCHLLAISNLKHSEAARTDFATLYKDEDYQYILNADEYRFANLLFEFNEPWTVKNYTTYCEKLKKMKDCFPLKEEFVNDNRFIINYWELFNMMPENIDYGLKCYLNGRYMSLHKI